MDDGWYVGRLREVPGVFNQGETLNELEESIRDAHGTMTAEKDEFVPDAEVREKEVSFNL